MREPADTARPPTVSAGSFSANDDDPIVCLCNGVRVSAIVDAVEDGADDLSAIFDATWAGCGPCGGSCQADILALLDVLRDSASDAPR